MGEHTEIITTGEIRAGQTAREGRETGEGQRSTGQGPRERGGRMTTNSAVLEHWGSKCHKNRNSIKGDIALEPWLHRMGINSTYDTTIATYGNGTM